MPLAAVAGIGAIGSIASGIIGSNAAGHAADTQAAAANNAANLERQSAIDALNFNKQQYGNSLNLLSPFYNTGVAANSRLAYLMGLNPAQGLPAGVVNPNASSPTSGVTMARIKALLNGNSPDATINHGSGGVGRVNTAMPQNASMLQPGQNPFQNNPITSPGTGGTQFQMNPPITSPGTGGTQFQMNPPITSGGTGGAAALSGGTGADINPFPNGLGNLGGTTTANQGGTVTNADGSPGTVGRTDGGLPPGSVTGPDGTIGLGDPNPFGPGGFGGGSNGPNDGSFGSLAQGWNQTFQSPTAVTEQNDPGYQFRLQQGQQALQNSAAARGGLLSGGTAKALTDYNQNAASGEYGNVYNRALQNYNTNYNTFTNDQTNEFNRLMALQGGGQVSANNLSASGITAANNAANIGLTSAGQIGQQYNNAGAANASGYINSANAINGAIGGVTNSLSTLALLRQLQGGGSSSSGGGWGAF